MAVVTQERYQCPWCLRTGKVRDSITIDRPKELYYCHRCGKGGSLRSKSLLASKDVFVQAFIAAYRKKAVGSLGVEVPVIAEPEGLPEGFRYLRGWESDPAPFAIWRYLRKVRGIRASVLRKAKVGWTPRGRYQLHAIFPVSGGFTARSVLPGVSGYWHSRGLPRKEIVYDPFKSLRSEQAYVVEGPIDALRAGFHGVATLGKGVSDDQVDLLAASKARLIVAYDGDAWEECMVLARRIAMRRIIRLGRGNERVSWLRLPAGKDPGILGLSGLLRLSEQSPWEVSVLSRTGSPSLFPGR